ncbi:hypothetical protein BDP27DRAFT_964280 [Rhodocollybia butyracea]|uniref:RRM domain-containing protein n=1 Tax=Rhodocollybia butyracea TaxID=206335 RepID=A0A9P5UE65_9AGAR|nr:hypothetical protein BDP27DRAFT_964280 [Rhodocollybia butyracea]
MRLYCHNVACTMKKTTAQINVHRAGTASYKSSKLLDSKKAADKREAMMKCKRPEKFCAYVGNLHPLTTVVEVTDLFEHCDGLSEVRLRVGHGSAQEAKPGMYFDDLDVQYATVEVSEWNGLVQAMKLNGTVVRGRRIVVNSSLPNQLDFLSIIIFRLDLLVLFSQKWTSSSMVCFSVSTVEY